MHGTMGNETETQLFTFRGRSMREAVLQLKETLGEDAVIQSTQRVRDPRGGYVEIVARQGARPLPVPAQSPMGTIPGLPAGISEQIAASALSRALPAQLGSARGPGAYARTAMATTPGLPAAGSQPSVGATVARRIAGTKSGPFAERAAWLASQIEQRQRAEGIRPTPQGPASGGLPAELAALQSGALPVGGQAQHVPMPPAPPPMRNYASVEPLPETKSEAGDDSVSSTAELESLRQEIESLKKMMRQSTESEVVSEPLVPESENVPKPGESEIIQSLSQLEDQMSNLVDLVKDSASPARPEAPAVLSERLRRSGVSRIHAEDLAARVCRAVPGGTADDGDVMSTLERFMADDMMCGGGIDAHDNRRRIMAFVGPTGVGKTTTVAKVASQARLAGKRVALITVDTCRAAAVEQLARYADVLDAPLKVVKEPSDLTLAIDEFSSYDVILVDTNGRNPRAPDDVSALYEFFKADWGGELILTLACSTRESDLHASIDAFGALGIAKLCITKVDETNELGVVYSLARRACRPLTWTTHGQTVPDDIALAQSETWAREILSQLNRAVSISEAS